MFMACEQLSKKVTSLKQERSALQEDLKSAVPGSKAAIAAEIKKLNKIIQQAQAELNACLTKNGL
jgi:hypothetical protein